MPEQPVYWQLTVGQPPLVQGVHGVSRPASGSGVDAELLVVEGTKLPALSTTELPTTLIGGGVVPVVCTLADPVACAAVALFESIQIPQDALTWALLFASSAWLELGSNT